jgi:Icc-related predicted phosphoesterase
MKVLASADVHGIHAVYDWLLAVASERHVTAMVLAGDLLGCLDGFDTAEEAQTHKATQLVELLESASMPVLYIMGNDDLVELNSSSARGTVDSRSQGRVWLSGGFWRSGKHFNVGSAGRVRAMILDLDTMESGVVGSGLRKVEA